MTGEMHGASDGYYEIKYRDSNSVIVAITHSSRAGADIEINLRI